MAGGEAGDVKSTATGLNGHDVEQIGEILAVIQEQGAATLQVGSAKTRATSFRLTFTDAKGALGSEEVLKQWIEAFPFLRVEVFDARGVRQIADGSDASRLGGLLRSWATP